MPLFLSVYPAMPELYPRRVSSASPRTASSRLRAMVETEPQAEKKERWTFSWKHLYSEVVTSGLCTGCAGCVIACPHDVLGYDDKDGVSKPLQLETEYGGPAHRPH